MCRTGEAELDAEQQKRIDWDAGHAAAQEAARRAAGELARRGIIEPEPEPEPEPAVSRAELGTAPQLRPEPGRKRSLFEAYLSLDPSEPNSYIALDEAKRRWPVAEARLAGPEIDEPELEPVTPPGGRHENTPPGTMSLAGCSRAAVRLRHAADPCHASAGAATRAQVLGQPRLHTGQQPVSERDRRLQIRAVPLVGVHHTACRTDSSHQQRR